MPQWLLNLAKWASGKQTSDFRTMFLQPPSALTRPHWPDAGLSATLDGREYRWRLVTSTHLAERLEVWAQTGARYGLAFAFPLLDRRVVEFALSLPGELFVRGAFRRHPFRHAMADVLPEKVRLRHQKYQPFPGSMLDLVDSKDELLARIEVYQHNRNVRRLIDLTRLRQKIEEFPAPDHVRTEMRGNDSPASAATMIAASHTLMIAEYLAQHGSDEP